MKGKSAQQQLRPQHSSPSHLRRRVRRYGEGYGEGYGGPDVHLPKIVTTRHGDGDPDAARDAASSRKSGQTIKVGSSDQM